VWQAGIVEVLKHPLDHLTDTTSELDREDEAFEKIQKAEKQPKALNKGGGMYPWEVILLKYLQVFQVSPKSHNLKLHATRFLCLKYD
jgi:hypothetical protein